MESNKRMNMENSLVLRKIPLKDFITILIELYDGGAYYIDFSGKSEGEEDTIQISVPQEYMAQEENDNITEEDLNDLIG